MNQARIMIMSGLCVLLIVLGYFSIKPQPIKGIPEFIPAQRTVLYLKVPAKLPTQMTAFMDKTLATDYTKNLQPLLKNTTLISLSYESASESILVFESEAPELLLQKLLEISKRKPRETHIGSDTFTFYSDDVNTLTTYHEFIVVAPSDESMTRLFQENAQTLKSSLNLDPNFVRLVTQCNNDFFFFANTTGRAGYLTQLSSLYLPTPAVQDIPYRAIGIGGSYHDEQFKGRFIGLLPTSTPITEEKPYRALLLPYVPVDTELLIGGQQTITQLQKIGTTQLQNIIEKTLSLYLPGSSLSGDIAQLFDREFVFSKNGDRWMLLLQLTNRHDVEVARNVWQNFLEGARRIVTTKKPTTIADGTTGEELWPAENSLQETTTNFEGVVISQLDLGEGRLLYKAVSQDKLIISNHLEDIKKVILLTKEPGRSARESELYTRMLQPILKNPELFGAGYIRLAEDAPYLLNGFKGVFGFSKHTFSDSIETDFTLSIQ